MTPEDAVTVAVDAVPDPVWADALPVVSQTPWLIVAWLGYSLAKRALTDLCRTVPDVLDVARRMASAAERIAADGITVRHDVRDGDPPARDGEP